MKKISSSLTAEFIIAKRYSAGRTDMGGMFVTTRAELQLGVDSGEGRYDAPPGGASINRPGSDEGDKISSL